MEKNYQPQGIRLELYSLTTFLFQEEVFNYNCIS